MPKGALPVGAQKLYFYIYTYVLNRSFFEAIEFLDFWPAQRKRKQEGGGKREEEKEEGEGRGKRTEGGETREEGGGRRAAKMNAKRGPAQSEHKNCIFTCTLMY